MSVLFRDRWLKVVVYLVWESATPTMCYGTQMSELIAISRRLSLNLEVSNFEVSCKSNVQPKCSLSSSSPQTPVFKTSKDFWKVESSEH